MPEHEAWHDRTALVVGGSRGIGRSIVEALSGAGANVAVTAHDRDADELEHLGRELARDGRMIGFPGRSDDAQHRSATVAAVVEQFGALDALVVAAGVNPQHGPLIEADLGAVTKVMGVNVLAALGWVQAAWVAAMRDHGGSVVLISSINARRTIRGIGAYNISKAALSHLTRQLAIELAPGVRVNAIEPGVVKTRFSRALYDGRENELARVYPLGRLGVPRDVAAAATFLLSDDASWITGTSLVVDGGVLLVAPE